MWENGERSVFWGLVLSYRTEDFVRGLMAATIWFSQYAYPEYVQQAGKQPAYSDSNRNFLCYSSHKVQDVGILPFLHIL